MEEAQSNSTKPAKVKIDWKRATSSLLQTYVLHDVNSTTKWNKNDSKISQISHLTEHLFELDYEIESIDNGMGQYCSTYPLKLFFIKGERSSNDTKSTQHQSPSLLKDPLHLGARFARVRTRFPMPVIFFRGKNICRSSSLSHRWEAIMQSTTNSIFDSISSSSSSADTEFISPEKHFELDQAAVRARLNESGDLDLFNMMNDKQSTTMDKHRLGDILLIKRLRISHIGDFMVENAKKMYGMTVCSSEKNDSYGRYGDFNLLVLPYPGVEFFKEFDPANHVETANRSVFSGWKRLLPVSTPPGSISYQWDELTKWNMNSITKNYLKVLLHSICHDTCTGLLVHCISGWDRTPLFVSLLRLSLWADGAIHKSLDASQILFLTLAYDWMLFRHQLVLRQKHGEDIFAYCFYFLEQITGDEFSVPNILKSLEKASQTLVQSIPAPSPIHLPRASPPPGSPATSSESIAIQSVKIKHIQQQQRQAKSSGSPIISPSPSRPIRLNQLTERIHPESQKDGNDDDDDTTFSSSVDSDSFDMTNRERNSDPSSPSSSFSHGALFRTPSTGDLKESSTISHPLERRKSSHGFSDLDLDEEFHLPNIPSPVSNNNGGGSRKERLDAVRTSFIDLYKLHVQPYFAEKRKSDKEGLWSWLPKINIGSPSSTKK